VIERLLSACSTDPGPSLSARPADAQALALLARAYANQGQLSEAQQWCERALAANKLDPGLHYLRATILLERGDVAAAKVALTRSLYLDQDFVLAHFALGNLARQQKECKEAQKYFGNVHLLLRHYQPDDVLPESEGMTAGRLAQIMATTDMR
jgi:chemotaxis protein methyltransferase CheR